MENTSGNDCDFLKRGFEAFVQGEYDKAIKFLDKVTSTEPNNADAWYYKGCVYKEKEEYDEAIRCFDRATSIEPNFVDAWYTKASVYNEKGETNEARLCWGKSFSDEIKKPKMEDELDIVVVSMDPNDEDS